MKLSGAAATAYFAKPDPAATGVLIFGQDAMRVAMRRQELIAALIGPEGEAEMRLSRLPAAEVRKDPAALMDALKAQGFFPGPRVAFLEDATDTMAPLVTAALKDWRPGDAQLVVTAGGLTTKSALVKLFDAHPSARCIGLYDDPPSREEIEATLQKAGLTQIDRAAMTDLLSLARDLDPGDFRQTVEKIALYKWGDTTPLMAEDVAAMAPATIEAEVDDLIDAVAEGRSGAIGPLIRRLEGQGTLPVTLCIFTLRHFRTLHALATDQSGQAVFRVRGPRKDRILRQSKDWAVKRLEDALGLIVDTDLTLRSTSKAPAMAVMERAMIRLAMMKR
ncbi:DNA polymerase III subunit delta [Gemmobacter fulvus]|uniref:DNA-directed DNA polymerase n=1 Tax=Gemmobacter fulvus TaxID=2840474 RepID=A0A975RZV7_9RHOB|nr:DNA polymerase III subunit delta [Gemmobacter fulvus]MBT9247169.1 DNA polymerase III subunit delta [Gemmobacter fulvus]QWK88957.1 DNA polymerase III subunit delta [Gemmobacter fulvus]